MGRKSGGWNVLNQDQSRRARPRVRQWQPRRTGRACPASQTRRQCARAARPESPPQPLGCTLPCTRPTHQGERRAIVRLARAFGLSGQPRRGGCAASGMRPLYQPHRRAYTRPTALQSSGARCTSPTRKALAPQIRPPRVLPADSRKRGWPVARVWQLWLHWTLRLLGTWWRTWRRRRPPKLAGGQGSRHLGADRVQVSTSGHRLPRQRPPRGHAHRVATCHAKCKGCLQMSDTAAAPGRQAPP
eukprot:scaffold11736_cov121-Isochrysis_galbana.AAC.3